MSIAPPFPPFGDAPVANYAPAHDPSGGDVISFALAALASGQKAAIATLVHIDGASPRAVGAQMAVAEDGRIAGSISSGCLERAIVAEARAAIARSAGGLVRYGKDSPFADIRLPCGSGVDILYTVDLSAEALSATVGALRERTTATLSFRADGCSVATANFERFDNGAYVRRFVPPLRLAAAGDGADLIVLSRLAHAAGYAFCALSMDEVTLAACAGAEKFQLLAPGALPDAPIDDRTGFVLLFHDHDWDIELATAALRSAAFYVGAVGSRRTHALRCAALRERGLTAEEIARINAPVGLIPATRDPSALAVSVLAGFLSAAMRR